MRGLIKLERIVLAIVELGEWNEIKEAEGGRRRPDVLLDIDAHRPVGLGHSSGACSMLPAVKGLATSREYLETPPWVSLFLLERNIPDLSPMSE